MAVRDSPWTLPNLLTLSRIPLAGALWLFPSSLTFLVAVMLVAALTDVLDGRIARARRRAMLAHGEDPGPLGGPDALGAKLDPICDKIFVISVLAVIGWSYAVTWELVLAIAAREVIQLPLVAIYQLVPGLRDRYRFDFRAGPVGKITTVLQFAAVGAVLFDWEHVPALAVATGVSGVLSAALYMRRAYLIATGRIWLDALHHGHPHRLDRP